jgi:hypothetical protein
MNVLPRHTLTAPLRLICPKLLQASGTSAKEKWRQPYEGSRHFS